MDTIPLDYATLRLIWWLLLGILLIGFAVMDGFDLGVATLLPAVARTDEERAMLMQIHAIDKAMEAQEKLAGGFATTADIINRITSETAEMTKSLREFADSIFGREELADPTAQYQELVEKAAMGDKAALAKLPDAINAYLSQAQGMSSSLADYQIAAAYARQTAYGVADVADARGARLRNGRESETESQGGERREHLPLHGYLHSC